MKKLTKRLITTGIFGLAVAGNVASADLGGMNFYVGVGTDYNNYKINDNEVKDNEFVIKKKNKGFGIVAPIVGLNFNDYFGIEAGYSFNKKINFEAHKSGVALMNIGRIPAGTDTTLNFKMNTKVRNAYLDFMGYLPVRDITLIGGVGVGRLMAKTDNIVSSISGAGIIEKNIIPVKIKNKNNWRIKAGVQLNVIDNINIRILGVYQKVKNKIRTEGEDEDTFIKNMKSIGLSLTYNF